MNEGSSSDHLVVNRFDELTLMVYIVCLCVHDIYCKSLHLKESKCIKTSQNRCNNVVEMYSGPAPGRTTLGGGGGGKPGRGVVWSYMELYTNTIICYSNIYVHKNT